jgi:hypothetical protein
MIAAREQLGDAEGTRFCIEWKTGRASIPEDGGEGLLYPQVSRMTSSFERNSAIAKERAELAKPT